MTPLGETGREMCSAPSSTLTLGTSCFFYQAGSVDAAFLLVLIDDLDS